MIGKMNGSLCASIALFTLLATVPDVSALTGAEIVQIEADLGIILTTNQIQELDAVVNPTNSAQWRTDAYARIEANRKADLDVQIVDMNGDPVEGAQVSVKLKSNDFKFGGIMSLKDFTDEDNNLGISVQTYRDRFLAMFNSVGLDNGFKPKQRAGNEALIPGFLDWAQTNNLPVRGHLLIWPGNDSNNHMPNELPDTPTSYSVLSKVEAAEADPGNTNLLADLKSEVDYMIGDWASQWSVYEWDVINETLSNHRVQDLLGYEETAEWFKVAESNVVDPNCKLLINEFQIISARSEALNPGHYTGRRDAYYESIDHVIDNGGRLDRIGFQSRVKFEVPDPQTWVDRLEEFTQAYDRPMVGTEFEVRSSDPGATFFPYEYTEVERAEVTESLLTAYFSHPMTIGLHAWTYMKGFDRDYSMCYYDGTVKLNGLAWYYLHRIRYNTDVTLASSLNGKTALRAFKGDYEVSVSYKGQDYVSSIAHTNNQSIVITLTSSVADDSNTSEVVDAWHYDGLTNGAGLAQGVSTGAVGGVAFNNTALAAMQNEAVRWQSDGVSDSMYAGKNPSSYGGADTGRFQLSVDFLDADFSASAAISNGSGRVTFGLRNDPGGTKDDAYFRLAFHSGGGLNAQYRLEVKDAGNNNLNVATFSGTALDHLAVRAVYDLDNDLFNVYCRHDGGAEVLAHSGTLVPGFAIDQIRNLVQVYDGGVNWAAGDQVFTDNLIFRSLGEPPPPPSEIVIDGWDFDGLTNAGLVDAKSYGVVGGAFFSSADAVSIDDGTCNWMRFDMGDDNESVFRTADPSNNDGATSGVYQVSWDYVLADFANTDASNKSANVGFGLRNKLGGNQDIAFRLRYDGAANQFLIQLSDENGNNQGFANSTISGNTLSNLMVRMVVDLDNRGTVGSVKLYYTPDGGSEMVLTESGLVSATFQLDQYRYAVQSSNGGTDWQLGDVVKTDNLIISQLMNSLDTPLSLLNDWLADYPSLGSKTNLTDNPDLDIANNLVEYAFGGDPTNGLDVGTWPTADLMETGGSNYIEYVYTKRNDAEARGLGYVLETTDDLVGGVWTNSGYIFVGEGVVDGEFDAVTNRIPAIGSAGFIRLNIDFAP